MSGTLRAFDGRSCVRAAMKNPPAKHLIRKIKL